MKFTIKKSDIVDVLGKIQGLTGRRSNLAITECVLITTSDANVHLKATDLETCFEGSLPAIVETSGTIAISARKFYEICREFPSSDILIDETENRWINISDKKVHYHLMGMNAEDFPDTPVFENVDLFELPAADFKRMIEKSTMISGIGEDKKPHINGVLFERINRADTGTIRMVSTDGSRLSRFDLSLADKGISWEGPGVLVPKKGLHEVSKFLDSGGTVHVGLQDSYFIVKGACETIAVRLLEGQFPPYADLISRQTGHRIPMQKDLFVQMLKRMSILCTENYRAAIFTFEEGRLSINATNPDIGESKEAMSIEFDGDKIEAAFNPKFFIEAVSGVDDENILVNIVSDDKPCLVDGVEDKSYLSAIMPMRV
ncbi:DNA polymerase III subunit beta [Desulfatitalea tepidiphila]|uniref:DNA polymerase III subunit beta n=1 Tax=Desulfatitalea tepidiphila TaxID=1185843 RepID=UPI0006B44413|nr:DNA polymerase III subunit beta [Desulfatitalea tepidiphila]